MTRLVLMGPPGVGKGTQARIISEKLGIPAISTGQIFRTNMAQGTELGVVANQYISQGRFVPDSVTNPMVAARLSSPDVAEGFLLDGYPRNLDQAHSLRDMLASQDAKLDVVIDLNAPHDVLVEHMVHRAQIEGRTDDSPEVFAERLHEYHRKTEPVSTYYADQDLLEVVDGVGTIEEVSGRVFAVLQARTVAV